MAQNVRYCKTLEQVNHSCLNPTIYIVNHSIQYQSLCQNTENSSRQWTICKHAFVISIRIDRYDHRFEIYTLVSKIHENVDIGLGIKNVFKLESVINS